jgi:Lon protease-like protein
VCLILQGEEVATVASASPEIAGVGTLARITDFDVPQLGILHVSTAGGTRFLVRKHEARPNGLVVGEVTPIDVEPAKPLADEYRPLAQLLELIATRVGPQNFPTDHAYDDASWVGYRLAELCRCHFTSSKACSRSTTPRCVSRSCRSSSRSRA